MKKGKQQQDSDLADLLGNAESIEKGEGGNETAAVFNLDHLTQEKVSVSPSSNKTKNVSRPYTTYYSNQKMSLLDFCSSYIAMLCHYYPRACACFTTVTLLTVMVALGMLILNPTQELGVIHHHVTSKYDLTLGQVDHWCLRGGNDNCACEDPLTPLPRAEHLSWVEAVKMNRKTLQAKLESGKDVNIAFVGESIIEAMAGRWMGKDRSAGMKRLAIMFRNHFDSSTSSSQKKGNDGSDDDDDADADDDDADELALNGVALGIAGDTAPNVLWRLMHGELPDKLQPKIFWVSLGMNDLARMQCSEEIVVLGILRVVEELMEKRPNARIVINSVFPMSNIRGGAYPVLSSFNDAFAPERERGGGRERERFLRRKKKNKAPDKSWAKMTDAERAEVLEARRDKNFNKRKKGFNQYQKDRPRPRNPLLQNKEKVRKYNIPRIRNQMSLPFWRSIVAINRELQSFAQKNDRVHFFDSTDMFVQRIDGRHNRLKSGLITMSGHLTPMGFSQWEDAVAKYASNVLQEMRKNEPELFETKTSSSGNLGLGNWFGNGEDDFGDSYDSGDGSDDSDMVGPLRGESSSDEEGLLREGSVQEPPVSQKDKQNSDSDEDSSTSEDDSSSEDW